MNDSKRKPIIIAAVIFIVLIVLISIVYLIFTSFVKDSDNDMPIDPITDGHTSDLPAAAGFEDNRTIITSLTFLTQRGMSLDQVNYFNGKIIEFVDDSDYKHDKILRIDKGSIARSSTPDGVETKFKLYLTDSEYFDIKLLNGFAELYKVDIIASTADGKVVYEDLIKSD